MTIEFWPRRLLQPKPRPLPKPREPRARRPPLPLRVGQAHQKLSQAIICGDHELASWIDQVVKRGQVIGKPEVLEELKRRLDAVMEPHPDSASPAIPDPSPAGLPATGAP
jgi:hypothetical protein